MSKSVYKLIKPTVNKIINFSNSKTRQVNKYSNLFFQVKKKSPDFFCWSSNCLLLPFYINRRIAIHNGKLFSVFQVKKSMMLVRSGLLVRTKKLGSLIHLVKKNYKKGKK